ncbi:MAG: nitroreductase family deazaflavin-dependent oxidoreductase [Anaerolineae bacterium]|nr:nitroreductase family deazaflavin-dependent oxidoreductase [Anaerolineae bacterium]
MVLFHIIKRWLYRGDRPNPIARAANAVWAVIASSGIIPNYAVTLEVTGRKSGRVIAFPVVLALVDGQRYIVSMLGNEAQWVRNVRATDGRAVIRSGRRQPVKLEEVPTAERPPILKNYLQRANGARPHIPVDKDAPLSEFEAVAASFPAFRIVAQKSEYSCGETN